MSVLSRLVRLDTVHVVEGILREEAVALGLTIGELRALYPARHVRRASIVASVRHLEEHGLVAWHGGRVRWTGPLRPEDQPLGLEDYSEIAPHLALPPPERVERLVGLSALAALGRVPEHNLFEAALLGASSVLKKCKVDHSILGDYALAYHGAIRPTRRVELHVAQEPYRREAEKVAAELAGRGFRVLGDGRFALDDLLQVELIPLVHPWDLEARNRCLEGDLLPVRFDPYGFPRYASFAIARPEDLVLRQLQAFTATQDREHLDLAREVLVASRAQLDVPYLASRVTKREFGPLWKEEIEGAGVGRRRAAAVVETNGEEA